MRPVRTRPTSPSAAPAPSTADADVHASRWAPDDYKDVALKHNDNSAKGAKSAMNQFIGFCSEMYGDPRDARFYTAAENDVNLFSTRLAQFNKRAMKLDGTHYKPCSLKGINMNILRLMNDHARDTYLATLNNIGGATVLRKYNLNTDPDMPPAHTALDNAMKEGTKAARNNRQNAPRVTKVEHGLILASNALFGDDAYSFNLRIFYVFGKEYMLRGMGEHYEFEITQLTLKSDEDGVEILELDPR